MMFCVVFIVCVSVSEDSAVSPEAIPEATDAELKLDEDTNDISLGNVSIESYCECELCMFKPSK